ncbi:hypothetical protein [Serinicoccus sp. LYQ131]|uniref:hypothetical protein n=1 Tax=Serinicoccus sp. LYQ131 TaxID=3378797 RepID=UPI003852798D
MTLPHRTRTRRAARGRGAAVLLALGALVLAGCDDGGEDDGASTTQGEDAADQSGGEVGDGSGDGEAATGDAGDPEDADDGGDSSDGPPTEPADIEVVAQDDREVEQGDGTVVATGAPVAFTSPTGNVSCVMSTTSATCQVSDKTYTPPGDQLVGSSLGGCTAEDADALILTDQQGAWTCPPEPLAPVGALDQGGWWAAELGGETVDIDGVEVAVLPYGQELQLGPVSCSTAEDGVSCDSTELGRQFSLSRSAYRYG